LGRLFFSLGHISHSLSPHFHTQAKLGHSQGPKAAGQVMSLSRVALASARLLTLQSNFYQHTHESQSSFFTAFPPRIEAWGQCCAEIERLERIERIEKMEKITEGSAIVWPVFKPFNIRPDGSFDLIRFASISIFNFRPIASDLRNPMGNCLP